MNWREGPYAEALRDMAGFPKAIALESMDTTLSSGSHVWLVLKGRVTLTVGDEATVDGPATPIRGTIVAVRWNGDDRTEVTLDQNVGRYRAPQGT